MKRVATVAALLLLTGPLAACAGVNTQTSSASTPTAVSSPQQTAASTAGSSPSASATASAASTYTMADVGKHNNEQSCWTVVDGKVYDVTQWIGQHPGGRQRILNLCGKDGSADFTGQHGNDDTAKGRLASFEIGTLG